MLKELMGLWSSGLPSALRSAATTVRGMSPRKQVTSVQRLGRGFGHASCNVPELIRHPREPLLWRFDSEQVVSTGAPRECLAHLAKDLLLTDGKPRNCVSLQSM